MADIVECDILEESVKDDKKSKALTAQQLQRMRNNQQKALQLRKSRIADIRNAEKAVSHKAVNVVSHPRDTGGGFFVEEEDVDDAISESQPISNIPVSLFSGDRPICIECNKDFNDSYLQAHFDYLVCDSCRDKDGAHAFISKTDAKKEYMLKDCDFDKREPPLKFILRKNPHNKHGNMKLYLRLQVEKRALEIFDSEENFEDVKEQKEEAQLKRKQKAFDRKVKALRMEVRSSLYRKVDKSHTHSYGTESYNEENDTYEKSCSTCGHKLEYEKM